MSIREKLEKLRLSHHICEEDCWYSCPMSEECCNDTWPADYCSCGAKKHNEIIDEIIKEIGDVS